MEFVMKKSCLGIEYCGCVGLQVMQSSYPSARRIAYATYDSVVGKIRDEFPGWNPPFSRDQMGPSISLKAGRTNQLSGQVQAYASVMGLQLPFLPKLDTTFELGTSRLYYSCKFTYSFFGAQLETEVSFDITFSPFSLYMKKNISWDFGKIVYNALGDFFQAVLDRVGVSFSTPGGFFIGGGTSGFKIGFSIFGWDFPSLPISFGRVKRSVFDLFRRKLQEGNQTFLARVKSFDSRMTEHTLLTQLDSLNSSKHSKPLMTPAKPDDDWDFYETLEDLFALSPCYHGVLLHQVPRFSLLTKEEIFLQRYTELTYEKIGDDTDDPKFKAEYEVCYKTKLPEVFRENQREEQAEDIILLLLQEGVDPYSIRETYSFEIDILPDLYEIAFGHKMEPGRRLSDCALRDIFDAIEKFVTDPVAAVGKMVDKIKDVICDFVGVICEIVRCLRCFCCLPSISISLPSVSVSVPSWLR
jgi:hypothetical protein